MLILSKSLVLFSRFSIINIFDQIENMKRSKVKPLKTRS